MNINAKRLLIIAAATYGISIYPVLCRRAFSIPTSRRFPGLTFLRIRYNRKTIGVCFTRLFMGAADLIPPDILMGKTTKEKMKAENRLQVTTHKLSLCDGFRSLQTLFSIRVGRG